MQWRLAKALEILRSEVNAKYPNRSRDSDGSIGDAAHASRSSDHNPWIADPPGPNVVSAIDLTHDPSHGFDSYAFAEWLRGQRDPRIKYVISNGRIFSSEVSPWVWRKYSGSNKHDHHVHVSVQEEKRHYDDVRGWGIAELKLEIGAPETHPKTFPATIRRGATGAGVMLLQSKLSGLKLDSMFGQATQQAVIKFQKAHGLVADGVVGPATWKALMEEGEV